MTSEQKTYWQGVTDERIRTLFHQLDTVTERLAVFEAGLTDLDRWRYKVVGAALALSAASSILVSLILHWIGG